MFGNIKDQLEKWIAPNGQTSENDATPTPTLKERSRAFFQTASEKLGACREAAGEKANQVAEKVAATITDWTGRETTSGDVKKVATTGAVIGATVGVAMTVGPMATRAMRQSAQTMNAGASGGCISPDVSHDPSQQWEQDDLDYDQQQYDLLQDHNDHMSHLDDVAADQISYNESFDMGGFDY